VTSTYTTSGAELPELLTRIKDQDDRATVSAEEGDAGVIIVTVDWSSDDRDGGEGKTI